MNIGCACQIAGYREYQLKTCRLDKATPKHLQQLTAQNLATLLHMLTYCRDNGIFLFRISSDIIPFGSHPVNQTQWWQDNEHILQTLGSFIKANGLRVSMHPGQYTILNSPNRDVVERSVGDLAYHTRLLDAMRLPPSHKIVLHIGGAYNDKQAALLRFIDNAGRLPAAILSRLVLENDEKLFTIEDVLTACHALQLPAILDVLHFALNPSPPDLLTYIHHCAATWKQQDGRQKIHYSQQRQNAPQGAHSHTIDVAQWQSDTNGWDNLDVMLEVKDKNLSAIKCNCLAAPPPHVHQQLLREWERYQYLIMAHSSHHYQQLQQLIAADISAARFYQLIDQALSIPPTRQSIRAAALQLWQQARHNEKPEQIFSLVEKFGHDWRQAGRIFNYLYRLAVKNNRRHLLDGYSFYPIQHP